MNIVNETANKVRELEKRLDAAESFSGLSVVELRKEFEGVVVGVPLTYNTMLCRYSGNMDGSAVVFQGQFDFALMDGASVRLKLMLRADGYVVHSETVVVSEQKTSFQVIHTLPSATNREKVVELVLEPVDGTISLLGYNAFIWGYGLSVEGRYISSGGINGVEAESGEHALFLVADKVGYFYRGGTPTSINFSVGDFVRLGKAVSLDGAFFPRVQTKEDGAEETIYELFGFLAGTNGALSILSGEGLETETEVISGGVKLVSAVFDPGSGVITIVYAGLNEVFCFDYDGETATESTLLYSFDEKISELSLVKNPGSTAYLVVGLASGKNYLFSSVTTVSAAKHEGFINLSADAEFF